MVWRILRVAMGVFLAAGAVWWLTVDTYDKYAPAAEDRPLRVSFWGAVEEFEMWKELLASFGRENPDIPTKMEYIPGRYEQKLQQLMVAGEAPDVILYQDEPFPECVENAQFEPLGPVAERHGDNLELSSYWTTAVQSFGRYEADAAGGRTWVQYGMPVWGGCNLIYYNKRCFADAKIRVRKHAGPRGLTPSPDGNGWLLDDERWTVDDFLAACKLLTVDLDGDGRTDRFGFTVDWHVYWLPFLYAFGGDILTPDLTHTAFHGPGVEASLQFYQDLIYKYAVSPRAAEMGQMNESVGFLTGRVAMYNNGPWNMPFLNSTGMQYDVLHIPRNTATLERATRVTWDAVTISRQSKQKDRAWRLVKFLTSMESMETVARVQRSIPARKAAADYFVSVNPKVDVRKFVQTAGTYARMQPITRYWPQMDRTWKEVMDDLRADSPGERLTPREAIGKFYSDTRLMKLLPPSDEAAAERYRDIYRRRLAGGAK